MSVHLDLERRPGRPVGPGPRSYALLEWVGRLGVAGVEPIWLALDMSRSVAYSHIARLCRHGLLLRVATHDACGGAVAITPAGVRVSQEMSATAVMAPRPQAASLARHARTVSWVAASMQRRGFDWAGPPQLREQGNWRVTRDDHAQHSPDLGVIVDGRRLAVEVELQPKAKTRLLGILNGYRRATEAGQLDGVTYVCGRPDIARLVQSQSTRAELGDALELGTVDQVIRRARQPLDEHG